jgi:hypothetical protein
MPIEHPSPSVATVKFLYAHAFRCAFEGCRRPLYRVDEQTGHSTLNSRVCHINARREGGPRWDPNQSKKDNRSEKNLILLCVEHASAIDDAATVAAYQTSRLLEWKKAQFEEYSRLKQCWPINDEMASDAIAESYTDVEIAISNSILSLGGEGGRAPGAGGGGGGAIGRSARAGRGGDGGDHQIVSGKYALPITEDALKDRLLDDLSGELVTASDTFPGSGGGGGGAIGEGAVAGNGGGGGEQVLGVFDLTELNKDGLHHIEVRVGNTGLGATLPGQHGVDGQDSILNFVTKEGEILRSVRAAGGIGGKSGASILPEGAVEVSAKEIDDGFQISALMAANAIDYRDGLLFVLGGDWATFSVPRFPFDTAWQIACSARWRTLDGDAPRGLYLALVHPDGREVSCQSLVIPSEARHGGVFRWGAALGARFDREGAWTVRVHSGGCRLAEVHITVSEGN